MPEVLRTEVVGARSLGAPASSFDPATAAAVDAAVDAAERRAFAAGEAAGRQAAHAELAATVGAVSDALDAVRSELVDQRGTATSRDLACVEAVVTAVLGEAPPTAARVLVARVREAVDRLDDPQLPVRLHPADADTLGSLLDDPRIELVADPQVARGDARIEGTWGRAELTRAAVTRAVLATLADTGEVPA